MFSAAAGHVEALRRASHSSFLGSASLFVTMLILVCVYTSGLPGFPDGFALVLSPGLQSSWYNLVNTVKFGVEEQLRFPEPSEESPSLR